MKFGVIGFGSIGKRHVENLLNHNINDIFLLRDIGKGNHHELKEYFDIDSLLLEGIDGAIISNPTFLHSKYLFKLIKKNINLLVEKPLVASSDELNKLKELILDYKGIGMTAYNMRFHPCVNETKRIIDSNVLGKIHYARFFVGQYLPDWRPNTNHHKSYSSKKEEGGGVLFDLIHEIDLAFYLIDKPSDGEICKIKKITDLTVDSEDVAEIIYMTKNNCLTSIHLDYISRTYRRYIEIVAEKGNLVTDFSNNSITANIHGRKSISKSFNQFSRNDMYDNMLLSFLNCIGTGNPSHISIQDGIDSNEFAIRLREEHYGKN